MPESVGQPFLNLRNMSGGCLLLSAIGLLSMHALEAAELAKLLGWKRRAVEPNLN
jgi:hypothetical protein